MTSTSTKRSIDDLELEECCRSIKRLAVSPRGEGASGAGDKITPSGSKIKKKPWRLQMQPKQTPKIQADQKICSPLKSLEDQISMMLKTIRYSIQSITEKETLDRVDVSSSSLPIKKTKTHARQSRRKPYQKPRPGNTEDKDSAKDNPMIAALPTVIAPVNRNPRQGTSSKKIPILVPKTIATAPVASEVALPTKDKKNPDKANSRKRRQKGRDTPSKKIKVADEFKDGIMEDLISQFTKLAI